MLLSKMKMAIELLASGDGIEQKYVSRLLQYQQFTRCKSSEIAAPRKKLDTLCSGALSSYVYALTGNGQPPHNSGLEENSRSPQRTR